TCGKMGPCPDSALARLDRPLAARGGHCGGWAGISRPWPECAAVRSRPDGLLRPLLILSPTRLPPSKSDEAGLAAPSGAAGVEVVGQVLKERSQVGRSFGSLPGGILSSGETPFHVAGCCGELGVIPCCSLLLMVLLLLWFRLSNSDSRFGDSGRLRCLLLGLGRG